MLRPLYDAVLKLAASRQAPAWLAVVSFAESSVFPIPPDVMLAPMVFARPQRAFVYAGVCTIASVIGGMVGYAIGMFLTDIGQAILNFFGHGGDIETFRHWYDRWGVWVILGKGLTPLPLKIVTITSGFLHFNFLLFVAALHAYLAIRNDGARPWQEQVADYAFLGGMTVLALAVLLAATAL